MKQKHLGNMMRYLVVALALCSSLALFACSSGDDDDAVSRDVNRTIPVNQNILNALTNQSFSFANGAAFSPALANTTPVTLRFPTTTTFALTGGGGTATGNATLGSVTFLILVTGGVPGLTANQSLFFPIFNIVINAVGIEVGGGSVQGQVTLVLINAAGISFSSAPITLVFSIDANGFLIINGVTTNINTTPTGATGTGGQ